MLRRSFTYLQSQGLKPNTIPFTGQDATPAGIDNIISGYQCGTVFKPSYIEAQATAALAIYLRAGEKPPKGIINGTDKDSGATISSLKNVPSVLLTPLWETASTIESQVIASKQVDRFSRFAATLLRRLPVTPVSRRTLRTARSTALSNIRT